MKTTAEKIAVMQAAQEANYKGLQLKNLGYSQWKDWTSEKEPYWNWGMYDYRMKDDPPRELTVTMLAHLLESGNGSLLIYMKEREERDGWAARLLAIKPVTITFVEGEGLECDKA